MNAADLAFSPEEYLRLIESLGLTGTWTWTFATNEQTWSPGLYRILGMEPSLVRPSYDLFRSLVHPEDRSMLESVVEVMHLGCLTDHTVRVQRPDGGSRTLSCRGEVLFSPDGRPRSASGLVLDITNPDRLARAQAAERQRRWALFEQTGSFQFTLSVDGVFHFPKELFALTGLTAADIAEDAFVTICREEREHWRGLSLEARGAGLAHSSSPLAPLAGGGSARFRVVTVPVRSDLGLIKEWSSITVPVDTNAFRASDSALEGLEQAVCGAHIRAARALLDWSMADLARASGVSFHTIRRIEEDAPGILAQTRHLAIAALRRGGIRFVFLDDGSIATARV
ncbi:DNA-binding XRE family transcriptional regulator [Methylobacterium sp. BE186]|uniref:PAS domain-containing protein n=1 Tax=Methylobacterium sp. BE186 TaxID=2817715 RepID=UPI00286102EB|nr:PAS domain-containing protein [Methylobacterium sp. BE186]MDR7039124.1 DNA-binding XRE family transcriptional regulator [Methylobacterium sp. BE186]